MSVDHNLSIRIKYWRRIYFGTRRAFIAAFILVIFFLLLNSSILVSFGYEINLNETHKQIICFYSEKYPSTKWMEQWGQAHLMLYSIIPFILLGISNMFLLRKAFESFKHKTKTTNATIIASSSSSSNRHQNHHVHTTHYINHCNNHIHSHQRHDQNHNHHYFNNSSSKSSSFARAIIFNNLLFFIMTLPTALVSFYFENLFKSNAGRVLIIFSNSISFSYHALHFFINFFTNTKFKKKACETFFAAAAAQGRN
jgi:hypothetical protein